MRASGARLDLDGDAPKHKLTRDEKRGVIEAITDRIVISDNEITITLSYVPNAAKPPPTPSWKDRAKSPHTLEGRYENSNISANIANTVARVAGGSVPRRFRRRSRSTVRN